MIFINNFIYLLLLIVASGVYVYFNYLIIKMYIELGNKKLFWGIIIPTLVEFYILLCISIQDGKPISINLPILILFSVYWILGGIYFLPRVFDHLDNPENKDKQKEYFNIPENFNNEFWIGLIEKITFIIALVTILSVLITKQYPTNNYLDYLFIISIISGVALLGISFLFILLYFIIKYCWSFSLLIYKKDFTAIKFIIQFIIIVIITFLIFIFSIKMGLYLSPS